MRGEGLVEPFPLGKNPPRNRLGLWKVGVQFDGFSGFSHGGIELAFLKTLPGEVGWVQGDEGLQIFRSLHLRKAVLRPAEKAQVP